MKVTEEEEKRNEDIDEAMELIHKLGDERRISPREHGLLVSVLDSCYVYDPEDLARELKLK